MGYINFVRCQLAASITSTATSITLSSNTSPFNLPPTDGGTLVLADSINKPSKLEIITYTGRSGLVLTGIVRGAEGTTAQSWPSSSYCYMSFTASMLTSFKADMGAALQTVVNKQDKHVNLTALSGITSGTGLFKRASDGSWVLDTTQYSTVTLASAIPLAGTTPGSVGNSLKAAKEDHTHPLQTSVSGNAGTATKLASPISFTFTGGATGSLSSFDGSSNVTITLTVDANGHTHGLATSLVNGLMSSAQFTKLAGIADNANNYVHPTGAGYSHIPTSGTNVNRFLKSGTNDTYSWSLLSKTDVGLSNVDNTADIDKPLSTATTNALLNKVNTSSVGVAGGLATLDVNTQVPSNQLPNASSSIYGVVKLSTDTTNTITANTPSSTSNRTYQIQKNTGGGLVVNIPWTDTVYTHPVSGVTTGSYTKVTVDTNGHVIGGSNPTTVEAYGITNAVRTGGAGSGVNAIYIGWNGSQIVLQVDTTSFGSSWPISISGNAPWSNITGKPTTIAGYGITDATPSSHIGSTGAAHGIASSSVNGFMSSSQVTSLNTAVSDISTLQTSKENAFTVLPVSKGGSGVNSLSGVGYFNGTSPITAATSTQIRSLIGTSTTLMTGLNADMLDGLHVNSAGLTASAHIPYVGADGVIELGKFIDFHTVRGNDFELRLEAVQVTTSQSADLRVSGGRTASAKVWHSDNHGANSGLDADLLDGKHASSFALVGHSHGTLDSITGTGVGLMYKSSTSGVGTYSSAQIASLTTTGLTVSELTTNGLINISLDSGLDNFAGFSDNAANVGLVKLSAANSFTKASSTDIVALVPDATTSQPGKMTTVQVSSLNELGGLVSMVSGVVKKTTSTTGLDTYNTAAISDLVTSTNVVTNLNADMLDGNHASAFALVSHGHSTASTLADGFMSSIDKSKIDLLNLSSSATLSGDSGVYATYSCTANTSRNGSRIILDVLNGATLTSHRGHKGGEFTCNSYLENSSNFFQNTIGVAGYGNLYGGSSTPGHLAAKVYGGYNVASALCTSDVNNYIYRMVGTYSGVSVDATKSKVGGVFGNLVELIGSGTTPTGYVTNAYGLYINASSINPYTTNLYSIYCDTPEAVGYHKGIFNIGALKPNNTNGGITLGNQYLYMYKLDDVAGTYYGIDSEGLIAGLADNSYVLHNAYGFKFGNAYSTTRESTDFQTLDWYEEASVTLTSSGLTTNTTATANLTRNGNLVSIDVPTLTGLGTATTFKLTGIPIQFRPKSTKEFLVRGNVGGVLSICRAVINTSGEVQLYSDLNTGTFSTTSNTRGINKISLTYQIH